MSDVFPAILAAISFLFGFIYIFLSIYLALFKNPDMDVFLYDDQRFADAIAAGGIPFGVLRVGEYGFYFIISRVFDKPINNFFKNARSKKIKESTILYEISFLSGTVSVFLLFFVYFFC